MNTTETQALLSHFITPPKGTSPAAIKDRILHWLDVSTNPQNHIMDSSAYAVAARRKTARQNLRKLILKYPSLAAELKRERESEGIGQ